MSNEEQNIETFILPTENETTLRVRIERINRRNFFFNYKKKLIIVLSITSVFFIGILLSLKLILPSWTTILNEFKNITNQDNKTFMTKIDNLTKDLKENELELEYKWFEKISIPLDNSDVYALLTISDTYLASGSKDKTVKIWNISDLNLIHTLNHTNEIRSITLVNENLICGSIGNIFVWNTKDWKLIRVIEVYETVYSITSWSNGLVVVGLEAKIQIWNITNGSLVATLKDHDDKINSLVILSDGNLASASDDRTIKIWNLKNATLIRTLFTGTAEVNSLIVTSNRLISGSSDSYLRIWNTDDYMLTNSIKTEPILALTLINNEYFLSASKNIFLWNLNTISVVKSFKIDSYFIWSLLALSNNRLIFGADLIYVFNLTDGTLLKKLTFHKNVNKISIFDN